MFCQRCGNEIPEDSAFCPNCGMSTYMESPRPAPVADGASDKRRLDVCLQQILSIILGVVFFYVYSFIGERIAANIGQEALVAIVVIEPFFKGAVVLFAAIGICLAVAFHKQDEQKRAKSSKISLLIFSVLQLLFILVMLFGGRQIIGVSVGNTDTTILNMLVAGLRIAAIAALVLSITLIVADRLMVRKPLLLAPLFVFLVALYFIFSVDIMLAIAVLIFSIALIVVKRLTVRKTLLFVFLVDLFALIFSTAIAIISFRSALHGSIPMLDGILIGFGIMQPVTMLLSCLGWDYGSRISTTVKNQSNKVAKSETMQMFCPQCGIRFLAGKCYCDQCGAELKNLSQPDASLSNPKNTNLTGSTQDSPSGGFAVLGFFFPLVGLILYLVWHDTFPQRAKSAGKGALAGVITEVVLAILAVLLQIATLSYMF